MKAERPDECRKWRLLLGAYALGDLPPEERAGLEAHLDGCPGCRAEAESLGDLARLLPLADPARFSQPAPQPSPDLGRRVAASIGSERRASRRRRRRRLGFAFAGAAAVAAVLAIAIFPRDSGSGPEQHVNFASLPAGIKIGVTLEPHSYGTEIRMYVSGVRSGTLCRVFLRAPDGTRYSAGSFRYRWGEDSQAVLSSALDLSRTAAIGVHAGGRVFLAPVGGAPTAAIETPTEEDAT